MKTQMQRWRGKLENDRERPAYLKIADIIAAEIDDGSLQVRSAPAASARSRRGAGDELHHRCTRL
ncbi:MAG: hypothetical protein NVV73_01480 [Cellvibrionaceae bacterium]|nr:hypothetical protein [Cellvibrionaceae bacterium]